METYYQKNKEKIKKYVKKDRKTDKGKATKRLCDKRYRDNNREKIREYNKIRGYWYESKIKKEKAQLILDKQNGLCAICGISITLISNTNHSACIDHCHKTNKIRGALCRKCNSGIGLLNDDINLLQNSINYLKKYM